MNEDDDGLNDLERLYKDLGAEVLYCIRQVKNEDQIYRRAAVRSIFAMVEGMIFSIKQVTLGAASTRNIPLSAHQISLLREEAPELTENGEISLKASRLTFKRNFQFAFRTFSEVHGIGESLDLSGEGWRKLSTSIKVRDRLMHPKKHSDIQISNEEVTCAVDGFEWFQNTFERFIVAASKNTEARIAKLNGGEQ